MLYVLPLFLEFSCCHRSLDFSLNHVVPLRFSYHFTLFQFTPSYGQQQDNANALPQYQHPPQMHAPPAGQPWSSSVPQSAAAVTSVQPAGVQSSGTAPTDAVSVVVPIL